MGRGKEGPLAFDHAGGPLVAVVGVAGGAATTTFALAVATQAAGASHAPVLLTELGAPPSGLAELTGQACEYGLLDLAAGAQPSRPFVPLPSGARLVAALPRATEAPDLVALHALLEGARRAHGLVVVDCGTLGAAAAATARVATAVAWTLPASPRGRDAARQAIASAELLPPAGRRDELLVCTAAQTARCRIRALRALGHARGCPVALVPRSDAVAAGDLGAFEEALTLLDDVTRRA